MNNKWEPLSQEQIQTLREYIDNVDTIYSLSLPKPTVTCSLVDKKLTASWGAVSGAKAYRVKRYDSDCTSHVKETIVTSTSYSESGLNNSEYCLHIRSCEDAKCNKYGDKATCKAKATTTPPACVAPSVNMTLS